MKWAIIIITEEHGRIRKEYETYDEMEKDIKEVAERYKFIHIGIENLTM